MVLFVSIMLWISIRNLILEVKDSNLSLVCKNGAKDQGQFYTCIIHVYFFNWNLFKGESTYYHTYLYNHVYSELKLIQFT